MVKVTQGTQGDGVFCDILSKKQKSCPGASFIKKGCVDSRIYFESHGTDIRALVVGDKVVASMRRRREEGSSEVTTT